MLVRTGSVRGGSSAFLSSRACGPSSRLRTRLYRRSAGQCALAWLHRLLRAVPDAGYPDRIAVETIKESIGSDDDLLKRGAGKLGDKMSQVGKPLQPRHGAIDGLGESMRGKAVVGVNVRQRILIGRPSGRGKPRDHL